MFGNEYSTIENNASADDDRSTAVKLAAHCAAFFVPIATPRRVRGTNSLLARTDLYLSGVYGSEKDAGRYLSSTN